MDVWGIVVEALFIVKFCPFHEFATPATETKCCHVVPRVPQFGLDGLQEGCQMWGTWIRSKATGSSILLEAKFHLGIHSSISTGGRQH